MKAVDVPLAGPDLSAMFRSLRDAPAMQVQTNAVEYRTCNVDIRMASEA